MNMNEIGLSLTAPTYQTLKNH